MPGYKAQTCPVKIINESQISDSVLIQMLRLLNIVKKVLFAQVVQFLYKIGGGGILKAYMPYPMPFRVSLVNFVCSKNQISK